MGNEAAELNSVTEKAGDARRWSRSPRASRGLSGRLGRSGYPPRLPKRSRLPSEPVLLPSEPLLLPPGSVVFAVTLTVTPAEAGLVPPAFVAVAVIG